MRIILSFLCVASIPYLSAQKPKFDLAAIRGHIENQNLTYDERFRSNDPAFYTLHYTADACILPDEMERICGREDIRAYYYNGGNNRTFKLKINTMEISGSAQTVVEEGAYEFFDNAGTSLDRGKFMATWVQEDRNWKLRREIWNSDVHIPKPPSAVVSESGYDSLLARKLGADDYGMKRYVLVMLKTGPAEIKDKTTVDSLFGGHMANIGRLANEGKLVLAGPIGQKEKYRGLFVFDVGSKEEAQALVATDPAVRAGLLEPELMPYYGSAALKMIVEWHERLQKIKF